MTKKSARLYRKRMFLLSSSVALLLTAGIAQAVSCDNSVNCESHVTITLKDGTCYYSWPTLIYDVAKLTQPKLSWQLDDANFTWDQGNGVRLDGDVNDPDQDLKLPPTETDSLFTWVSVQTPSDPHASDKTFLLRMNIYDKGGALCKKALGEPDYKIVLRR